MIRIESHTMPYPEVEFLMPASTQLIFVRGANGSGGVPELFFLVDTEKPKILRKFFALQSGSIIPPGAITHIISFVSDVKHPVVWHMFEDRRHNPYLAEQ